MTRLAHTVDVLERIADGAIDTLLVPDEARAILALLRDHERAIAEAVAKERAAHAETRAKLAEVERERDESRRMHAEMCAIANERSGAVFKLADAQAEALALREELAEARSQCSGHSDEFSASVWKICDNALSRAPGSLDALRAWGEKVVAATADDILSTLRPGITIRWDAAAIVARLLGEKDGAR